MSYMHGSCSEEEKLDYRAYTEFEMGGVQTDEIACCVNYLSVQRSCLVNSFLSSLDLFWVKRMIICI